MSTADTRPSRHLDSLEVVSAVNTDSKYLDCVVPFLAFWDLIASEISLAVTVRILVVADELPESLQPYAGNCVVVRPSTDSALEAQIGRVALAADSRASLAMTTDIDMFPLSGAVTERAIRELHRASADVAIVRDVLPPGQYPMCYVIASPATWGEIGGISDVSTTREAVHRLSKPFAPSYEGTHGGAGWTSDQQLLYEGVERVQGRGGQVLKLSDSLTGHKRMDRGSHPFPINWLLLPLVRGGRFSDYHVHHPIRRYKRFIQALLALTRSRLHLRRIPIQGG